MYNEPLQLRGLTLQNRLILAPMAGVTDVPFRRICQDLGAGLTYVEMLNSVALLGRSRTTHAMLERHAAEPVLGVQVTGRTPESVARGVAALDARGFDTIDINMGCPARKVVGSECGSAFLLNPPRISATVESARAATARPLSVKFRLGFDRPACSVEETTRRVVDAGADMFTIHGRFRSDDYGVRVDYEAIRRGREAVAPGRAICVGNGDVMDLESARTMAERTGCEAIMVSRGALGNPWLFQEILEERTVAPTIAEWEDVVLRHIAYQEECYGNSARAAMCMRKHLIWYATAYPGSSKVRNRFSAVSTLDEARAVVSEFGARHPRDLRRGAAARGGEERSDPHRAMDRQLDRGVGHDGLEG